MKCEACGVELDGLPDGREVRDGETDYVIHGPARCRDALKAQLDEARQLNRERGASNETLRINLRAAEKRAAEAEARETTALARLRGTMEALVIVAHERDAATAKLAEAERESAAAIDQLADVTGELHAANARAERLRVLVERLRVLVERSLDVINQDAETVLTADILAALAESADAPETSAKTKGAAEQLGELLEQAGVRPWFHKPGCSMWKGTHVCDKGCGPPETKEGP